MMISASTYSFSYSFETLNEKSFLFLLLSEWSIDLYISMIMSFIIFLYFKQFLREFFYFKL